MKVTAIKEKSGAYEFRHRDEEIFGGIIIDGKNRGVGFVGNAEENRYIFEFEDGMFSKSVKIFAKSKNNPIGKVTLGFTDTGTLKFSDRTYEWEALNSSKVWLDKEKDVMVLLDLENNAETVPNILISDRLESKTAELLILCGWFLLVVEWRAGLTNSNLAGMPVKTEDFKKIREDNSLEDRGHDWFDLLVDVTTQL